MTNVRKGQKGEMRAKRRIEVDNEKPTVIDFGKRTISNQNFSRMVALPKQALANCGGDTAKKVEVSLIQDKTERYLKLRPVCLPKKEREANE